MKLAGIDGCREGWTVVFYENGNYTIDIYENFETIIKENPDIKRLLIDMPLGLSSGSFIRTIESELRKHLKGKTPSVFNVPSRNAVYETDYLKASNRNKIDLGVSLSKQSFFIQNKIREIDSYFIENKHSKKFEIYEAHPELCFKYLNNCETIKASKKMYIGIKDRLEIIKKYEPTLVTFFDKTVRKFIVNDKRKVSEDDILDAICLCLTNVLGNKEKLDFLVDDNSVDEEGIEIKIAYYNPE